MINNQVISRPGYTNLASVGVYVCMKAAFMVLLSGLLLFGCSQRQQTTTPPASALVQPGKDTTWEGGWVLRVAKRAGGSLEGVSLTETNKPAFTYFADKAALKEASGWGRNYVRIELFNALCPTPKGTQVRAGTVTFILHHWPWRNDG